MLGISTDAAYLTGDIVATVAVGIGIVLETERPYTRRKLIAVGLVIIGVIAETLCSFGLFTHDEHIGQKQRSRIAALVADNNDLRVKAGTRRVLDARCFAAKLAGKPKLSADVAYTRDDTEAYSFAGQILRELRDNGWKVSAYARPLSEADTFPFESRSGIAPDAPLEIRAGLTGAVTLAVHTLPREQTPPWLPAKDPIVSLENALIWCAHEGGAIMADPRLPPNAVRIMVPRKSSRQPL